VTIREVVYWIAIVGAFAFLAVDLLMKGDQAWASIGCFLLIAVGVFTRPGGVMRRR
jgi:hypothetical protein